MYYQPRLKIKLSNLFRFELGRIQNNYIFAIAFGNHEISVLYFYGEVAQLVRASDS